MIRFSRHLKMLIAVSALGLAGCETLESLNPFGGGGRELTDQEKFDDRPMTRETGDIPADTANSRHTDEDLRPTP